MAADNDLEHFALRNIHDLERIGSSDDVAVLVQIDRRGGGDDGAALRGLLVRDPAWQRFDDRIASPLESMGETNTGEPSVLSDFIVWGVTHFPAERYAVVIWNHGSGWKPDFIYEAAAKSVGGEATTAIKALGFASHFTAQTQRILFKRTLDLRVDRFMKGVLLPGLAESSGAQQPEQLLQTVGEDVIVRAIGLDETSHDALDVLELHRAFTDATAALALAGREPVRFSFVGFDACLMAGIEVAYQLREVVDVIVGSEEIEPAAGWRYDALVETLARKAEEPRPIETYTAGLVDNYIAGQAEYKIRLVTQSAIRTGGLAALASRLDDLARLLVDAIKTDYAHLAQAEKTSTRFFDSDFIDIGDYLAHLRSLSDAPEYRQVWEAADAAYRETVVQSGCAFQRPDQRPTGLSFYYPTKPEYDPAYATLAVSGAMPAWSEFIRRYHFLGD